ncbi:MAG: S-layer homology domain-containing protein [Leptolyngbya sp. BL-A-14]
MRLSTATTLALSTLATVAAYQGFAALFPHLAHPNDDSASNAKKDDPKADETNAQNKQAIAAPESMPAINIDARTGTPTAAGQGVAATQRSTVALRKLPKVNVPPTLRSLPATMTASSMDNANIASVSTVASPESMMAPDSSIDFKGEVQPVPFQPGALPDIKGHWAQGYIESLAVKGIVQGFVDGKFHPDEPVTPRQFEIMAEKAFQVVPIAFSNLQQLKGDRPTRADAAALIYQTLAKAGTSPVATAVQISGAVPRPGIYAVPSNSANARPEVGLPTVTQAIEQAGGTLAGADLSQVQIHRVNEVTERQVINVDVARALKTGDRTHDLVLHQGDKLYIPAATTTSQVNSPLPKPAHTISLAEPIK